MTERPELGCDATVTLREITGETVRAICKLSDTLPEEQTKMVAPNAVSLAEAHFAEHAWFRAIYADETPVGFVMLWDDAEKAEYYLWRLMIATEHQRKGYGRRAIELLLDYVLKIELRSKPILHIPYIILEYIALFGLIGISFDIGPMWGFIVTICLWILLGSLIYLYWDKTTKRRKKESTDSTPE